MTNEEIQRIVSDTLIGKPIRFSVSGKDFEIGERSLGKVQIVSAELVKLGIDEKALLETPITERNRICAESPKQLCRTLAVSTMNNKSDLMNESLINERTEFFQWECEPSEIYDAVYRLIVWKEFENFITSIRLMKHFVQSETLLNGAVRVE